MYYCTNSRLGMIPRIPVASSFLGQHSQPVYRIIPSGHQSRHWKKMIFQCKSPLIGDFQLLCLIISWLSHVIPISSWNIIQSYDIPYKKSIWNHIHSITIQSPLNPSKSLLNHPINIRKKHIFFTSTFFSSKKSAKKTAIKDLFQKKLHFFSLSTSVPFSPILDGEVRLHGRRGGLHPDLGGALHRVPPPCPWPKGWKS